MCPPLLYFLAGFTTLSYPFHVRVEGRFKGKVGRNWTAARGVISYMLTRLIQLMNTCPAQQNMKHCRHGSALRGATSNKLHSVSFGSHTTLRWSFLGDGYISAHGRERGLAHMWSPRTARHADAASGLRHVCLPPQCDSKQTQSNEIHCREPVSSTLGARQRGRDSHTVSCSQSVNK